MYMCLSLLHIRVQTECRRRREKRGEGEEGKRQGIKRGLEEGLGEGGKKGGRKEERGRRKHMDLFKNTAIYQSQAHSESRCFKKKEKREASRDRMLEEQRRRGYPRVTRQETKKRQRE